MSSILLVGLPGGAIHEEVAPHRIHRVAADSFEHATVVERALAILDRGFFKREFLLVRSLDGARFTKRGAALRKIEASGDDGLLLTVRVEQKRAALRCLRQEGRIRHSTIASRHGLIERVELGGRRDEKQQRYHPTLPSKLIPSSFCASTANSIGNCFRTSRAKPLTISATAAS